MTLSLLGRLKSPGYHFTPARPFCSGRTLSSSWGVRHIVRYKYQTTGPKPVPKPDKRPPPMQVVSVRLKTEIAHSVRPSTLDRPDKAPNRVTRPSRTERKDNRPFVRQERKTKPVKQIKEKSFLHNIWVKRIFAADINKDIMKSRVLKWIAGWIDLQLCL